MPSLNNGEYDVEYESEGCFLIMRYVALLLSKNDNSSGMANNY